jgi:hypothetical protein
LKGRGLGAIAFAASLLASGCGARPVSHHLLDALMEGAHRPAPVEEPVFAEPDAFGRRFVLLSGDMHCHVRPPDSPRHVSRGLDETIELARGEGLDFVLLTPHVPSLFFQYEDERALVLAELTALKSRLPRHELGHPLFLVGFEYTDHGYGHVGAGFADLAEVLAAVPASEASAHPERFFEEWTRRGGILVINHPLLTPLDSWIGRAKWNLSWRPFTERGPFPDEILGAGRLAQTYEAYNLAVSELRDRYLLRNTVKTLEETFARIDREIVAQGRPMTPVGGSDSHSGHLRAAMFVLSHGRTEAAIREAMGAGRVCVRDPAACTFSARAPDGRRLLPGSSIHDVDRVFARAEGEDVEFLANGVKYRPSSPGEPVSVPLARGECAVIRARVGRGYAAPIYANCPF